MASDQERLLAERIAAFAAAPPAALLATAARHVADFLGVFLAGMASVEMRIYLAVIRADAGLAASNHPFRLDDTLPRSSRAAFLGAAAHLHDYDDDEPAIMVGHPTVAAAAAALASVGPHHSGAEFLTAVLAGIETQGRLGAYVNPGHYNRGSHATASLGVFGASAASGLLQILSTDQMSNALRFAASASSGLKASFGSSAKPIQVGRAAADGVAAAAMAAAGLEATPGLLFGKLGWVSLHGGDPTRTEVVEGFADPHLAVEPGLNIKRYPCCSSSHTAVDGLLDIMAEADLDAADIATIESTIGPDIPDILIHDFPRTGLEAKFSLRYPLAAAALAGGLSIADFRSERVAAPAAVDLMRRVTVLIDPALPRAEGGVTHCSRVAVTTHAGTRLERFTDQPLGSAARPLNTEDLRRKFVRCASSTLGEARASAAFDRLIGLPQSPNLADALSAIGLAS